MPNRYQLALVVSTVASFSALFLLSRAVLGLLSRAGYDPANIILIGLPSTPAQPAMSLLSSVDLGHVLTSPALVALAVTIAGTFYYFFHSTKSRVLNPQEWQQFPLQDKIKISPNTAIYRFKLPKKHDILGLPIGQHVSVSADINGKLVSRSYTPVSSDEDQGKFELLVKTYEKGNISRVFAALNIGDTIRVKGPKGNFVYTPGMCDHISMIAGGTGLTPMIQIIRAILRNPADKTTVTLIYANVNHQDILLKDDLDQLVANHSPQFKLFYVLNNPPSDWKGGVGFVTKDHINDHLQNPNASNSKLLMCGPPPMITAMKKNLSDLLFPLPNTISKLSDKVFVF
ncbi:NADH-cytochrome b5 reductase [Leucoagaricus gongylophorus]